MSFDPRTIFALCPECRETVGDADKVALLEHYAFKDVFHYTQYDGWANFPPGDCVMHPDDDGDVVMETGAWELRSGMVPVRIQILDGTPPEDAARILRKMIDWIGSGKSATSFEEMRPAEAEKWRTVL